MNLARLRPAGLLEARGSPSPDRDHITKGDQVMPLLRRDTDRTSVEHRPTPGRHAPTATRPGIDTRGTRQPNPQQRIERLLFVADAAVAGADELPPQVRAIIDDATEVYVVTPTLPGRLAWLADDVDRFRHSADE